MPPLPRPSAVLKSVLPALLLALVSTLVVGVTRHEDGDSQRASRRMPAALRAAIDREARERDSERTARDRAPFSQPDLAEQFYVNSRTGPITTRGANPTVGTRTLDPARYLPALQQMRAMPRYSTATQSALPSYNDAPVAPGQALGTWANLGPVNQGGRTRALLIHPTTPSIMYAGGVAGGVWKSTDGGGTWATVTDLQMANLAVATLAFDPANPNTIYAGTGEGVGNADAIRGAGIFRSTDAGATWTRLPSTNTSTFHYTQKIFVSPRNSQRLFAATRTGLFRSLDAGASWTSVGGVAPANGCTDMAIQSGGATGYVYVSCGRTLTAATVYRVPDDDTSTGQAILALPGMGRSSIAVAPSNEHVVYVLASQATNSGGPGQYGLHGVYRSTADGDPGSFTTQRPGNVAPAGTAQKINQLLLSNPVIALLTECGFGISTFLNQGWYDNVIAVDPLDENVVWAGGIDLWRSDDGGVNWGTAGYWWFDKGIDPQYHHADQHALVFHPEYNGTTNRVLFAAGDGGVDRTDNARGAVNTTLTSLCGNPVAGSPAWIDRNAGYVTTQFYDGATYPNGQTYFGGLQDNGTQRGSLGSGLWSVLVGGDGGYVAVDTLGDANAGNDVLFLENTGNSMQRSVNGGASFTAVTVGSAGVTPDGFLFIAPFAMNDGNRQQLWAGGFDIWRTTNRATTWTRATGANGTCGLGSVSAIATHPLDGNRVLVGMSDGCYHYNHAALTAPNTGFWPGGGVIGAGYLSWMTWDPTNLNVAYATLSVFGANNLFKTTDGGVTWAPSVGSGATALPQIPALTVAVSPADPQQVFVGTDLGVFTSTDGGASWYVENTGFANVPVESLRFSGTAPYHLYAFTHGRGAWRVSAAGGATAPTAVNDSYNATAGVTLAVGAPGLLVNDTANGGGAMSANLDSPPSSGTVDLQPSGAFTYTPAPGFSGTATFRYRASNTGGFSNVATVTIVVTGTPTTVGETYSTVANTPLTIATPGVLGNDVTNGGGAMTAVVQSTVTHGTLTLRADGGFDYLPATDYVGPDSFTYAAVNSVGTGNAATVELTVTAPSGPQPPRNFRVTEMVGTTVTFSWLPPVLGPAPTGYIIEGGVSPGSVLGALPLGPIPTVTLTLPPGSLYVRVRTIAGGATSAASNEIREHAGVALAPSAPADLLAVVSGDTLNLAWTNTFAGGELASVTLNASGTLAGAIPLGRTTTFGVAGVPPGTYTLSLVATNTAGVSTSSNAVTVTIPSPCGGAPLPVRNFIAYAPSAGTLSLAWDTAASGPAPTGYAINVTGAVAGSFPLPVRGITASVPPGTYNLAVVATNSCGTSSPSQTLSVVVP